MDSCVICQRTFKDRLHLGGPDLYSGSASVFSRVSVRPAYVISRFDLYNNQIVVLKTEGRLSQNGLHRNMTVPVLHGCLIRTLAELSINLAKSAILLLDQNFVLLDWCRLIIWLVPEELHIQVLDFCHDRIRLQGHSSRQIEHFV